MSEPRTAAGRALLDDYVELDWAPGPEGWRKAILAIEAEAAELAGGLDAAVEAARDLVEDRSPLDVDGETLDERCHFCDRSPSYTSRGRILRIEHDDDCEWLALDRALAACSHPVVLPMSD